MPSGNFFYIRLGKRIKEEREKKKITQEYLSLLCGIDRTYIARIEKGKANPSIKILRKICQIFEIKLHQLFKDL